MDAQAIRDSFDAQVRASPPVQVGRRTGWFDGVLRHSGAYNFIDWWDFGPARAFEIAAREAAFYAPLGDLKWKVYDHDAPANLGEALAAAGLVAERRETMMAIDLDERRDWPAPPAGLDVRRARDRADVADMVAVAAAAFEDPRLWSVDAMVQRLADPTLSIHVAHLAGRPVSAGRLEYFPGTPFAGLFGGGTVPWARGGGAYRAVVAARAEAARQGGARYLVTDARDTSRPILERLGFQPVAKLTCWQLRAPV